ncbi:MAG TPA: EamA family transporter, partial [Micromonosporaceae bacterium]
MSWRSVAALLFIVGLSTLWGWAAWGALIRRHGATTIAPFSMLVPFFGIASAALILGEPVHATDVIGGVLVVGGVLAGALAAPSRGPAPSGGVRKDAFLGGWCLSRRVGPADVCRSGRESHGCGF